MAFCDSNVCTTPRNENQHIKGILERMDRQFQQIREENLNFRKDNDTTHEKLKTAETKANEMENKWIEASQELQETKKKLERYTSSADEWVKASEKDGIPVWKNALTKEVITLPVTMKEFGNYQLIRVDEEKGLNVYANNAGKEITLPESLGDSLIEVEESKDETEAESKDKTESTDKKSKKEKGLRQNDIKLLNAVNASDHPLTLDELANLTGIDAKNISEYTSRLVSRKLIIEGHEGTKKVFSKRPG